jgi:uncharacterized membrane protein
MTDLVKTLAESISLGVEGAAALIIAYGAIEALWGSLLVITRKRTRHGLRKDVWLHFGVWLLLALEIEIAADIVRTAISPTWTDIGQLASIGIIRTVLNYFLEADLGRYEPKAAQEATAPESNG